MLDLSIPAVRKLWAWPAWWTQLSVGKNPLLVFAHTSFPSRDRRSVEPRADALQPPPNGKRGADLLAFWNGVKGHLGGGGRPRRPAGFEAAAIRGAPAGWGARCGGTRRPEEPRLRAPCPPRGGCGRAGRGAAAVPSGRLRAAAGAGCSTARGRQRAPADARRWRWPRRSAAGGRRRRCPGRAHTRAHTHTYTPPRTHSHTLRRAHAARRPEGGGSAAAAAAACSAGGREGWRAAPAPRLRGSVQPARPSPSDPPPGVARPHALQRRRSNARPRAALKSPEGAGDEGTMYRDPEAASPGKRGPARSGAPRTGGQDGGSARAPSRSPSPGLLSNRAARTPLTQGHPSPGGAGWSGSSSDPGPPQSVRALPSLMPCAGFAVSPQRPPPPPPAAQGQRVWRSGELPPPQCPQRHPWVPGSFRPRLWARGSGVTSAVTTVNREGARGQVETWCSRRGGGLLEGDEPQER